MNLSFILTNEKKLGRYIYGNRANEHMSVEELNALERYLEIWMYNIRSAKVIHRTSQISLKKYHFSHSFMRSCLTDADNDSRDPSTEKQGMSNNFYFT